jgi:hypothetical protein
MPQLIYKGKFGNGPGDLNPYEFFIDCYKSRQDQRFEFTIETTYKFPAYVHADVESKEWLINLRRFVDRRATGDAIYEYKNLDYRYCWNASTAKGSWDKKYSNVTHGYWVIHFEDESDMICWKLANTDITSDSLSITHPDYPTHVDLMSKSMLRVTYKC